MATFNQNFVWTGIGTLTTAVPAAGPYLLRGHTALGRIASGDGQSSLVTTINQNGTPKYTGTAGADGFGVTLTCAAGDTITVVFTSSAANDNALNGFKCNIDLSSGE